MTLADVLIRDLLASPCDDLPRLAFADRLLERGDPRGEFIHVQVALSRMKRDDPRYDDLRRREAELLAEHRDEWLGAMAPLIRRAVFRRGFLDEVYITPEAALADPGRKWPPTERRVRVDLEGFRVPAEVDRVVPESVARESDCFPLGFFGDDFVTATLYPTDEWFRRKIEFILNCRVWRVGASEEQILAALDEYFGPAEWESVDSVNCMLPPFPEPESVLRQYEYVGPAELRRAAMVPGERVRDAADLAIFLDDLDPENGYLVATFVIDSGDHLRLADRRSEHVACAGGNAVLSAGEMFFRIEDDRAVLVEVSNQSTGYCPEPSSWPAVAAALDALGVPHPGRFTTEVVFRRCDACGERNIVRDDWFECDVCGAELSRQWNFA